ncbi:hypothetical protein CCACVL1_09032 [Corchorus capsularis]|uniref:RNase III domain-containing protein n=1 Tax=Corchorus capsularis TaxID=210143 RepID=A0A1R3IXY9_COCAP|nr:hypothetical protein CCACVL1_09032 [Corchorus capsularis]
MGSKPNLEDVEKILSYKFNNKKLLEEAFTHHLSSSKRYLPNERLEIIGDSVLNLIVTKELFFLYPNLDAGHLTHLRSDNTDNEKLARAAVKHRLHQFIINKNLERDEHIQVFMQEMEEYPIHSHGLVTVPKILADIVESTIGAVYIDSNCSLETVWKVFRSVLEPIIYEEMLVDHPTAKLQDICQKSKLDLRYEKESWKKDSSVSIFIENKLVGKATYHLRKEIASNRAAKCVLDSIDTIMMDLGVVDYSNATREKNNEEEHEYSD